MVIFFKVVLLIFVMTVIMFRVVELWALDSFSVSGN